MTKNIFKSMFKVLVVLALFCVLVLLNFRVWKKDHQQEKAILTLQKELQIQHEENDAIAKTNSDLKHKIASLKRGSYEMIEEEARNNWGMVGENETFYHVEDVKEKQK